ncbi:MAG: DUF3536 domain-containing protein [Candidatus Omnitrophota bacterium]
MNKYICLHGHFYQPPRENPWLEEIELQDSAYPYKNWNQRITAECYAPNVASRILDADGDIVDIMNNYAKLSFNFGPTLLSWLERTEPDIYLAILKADKSSQQFFSGHGSAIAQAYNHMIMPLANARDKETQVLWGLSDFEIRFKRKPEGMWLPETAVDIPTLEVLAKHQIAFTILAPNQAKRFRKIGSKSWEEVKDGHINPQRSYLCRLPSGAEISLFFYDGPISHDIAFAGLLNNGEAFAQRLVESFPKDVKNPVLTNAATDGETFGHHHHFGNMGLSYCFYRLGSGKDMPSLTIYGEYLEQHPPEYEVEIHDRSAWSCAHGVERWNSDCGCSVGGNDWHQRWRRPLRESLDWLRDELAPLFEEEMSKICREPWTARNAYVAVIRDRSPENVNAFFQQYFQKDLDDQQKIRALKLLEMQRHAMLMYTSCGWFFDEISGIETVQILQYAARAIQMARDVAGKNLEDHFLQRLEKAESNIPDFKNGRGVYDRFVRPAVVDLLNVGAHFAISSLFEEYPDQTAVYSYDVSLEEKNLIEVGKQKMFTGIACIRSRITWESLKADFAVIHFGDYNISAGVRPFHNADDYHDMAERLKSAFLGNDIPDVIQQMNSLFGENLYSLWDLFRNEQGRVLDDIFDTSLESIENHFRQIYEHYYPLMQVKPDFRIPLPKALAMSVEFILNRDLIAELENDEVDFERLERLVKEVKRWNFTRNKETLNFAASQRLDALMQELTHRPRDIELLKIISELLRILQSLPLELELWRAQNIYFSMTQRIYPRMLEHSSSDEESRSWCEAFERLGAYLKVRSPRNPKDPQGEGA